MISLTDVTHGYATKAARRTALHGLSLEIAEGALFALTGPNGGGKSTLLRILCGLLRPDSGSARLGGFDVLGQAREARRLLGVVFQHPALDKHLTILENLRIHAGLYGMDRTTWRQRMADDLAWTGLSDRLGERVGTLSGGMARRVELVKAMLHRPRVLLMDEPTTGLDPAGRRDFLDTVRRLQRRHGVTVLMTSHLFDEAEQADRVGILHRGRLLAAGEPESLKQRLGREMLVVRTRDEAGAERLQAELERKPRVTLQRRGVELRVEGADGATLEGLILGGREAFQALSIKRPTLEDLFIHLTAGQPDTDTVAETRP